MNRIPQELADTISRYLSRDDLKNTLLLSRPFRFSAEKYSGAFRAFEFRENNAEEFSNTFSGHRLPFLRRVEFQPILPPIEHPCPALREPQLQLSEHDKIFTRQISFLYKAIKEVEDHARSQGEVGRIQLIVREPERLLSKKFGRITYYHHSSWRVHLLNPETLPCLESVHSLDFRGGYMYKEVENYNRIAVKLDYRVMVDLLVKLPNVEFWGCRIGGDEWKRKRRNKAVEYMERDWAGPRRDTRHDFAKALENIRLPGLLRRVRLDFLHDLHYALDVDQFTTQPNLVHPARHDPFSISLQHLSQQLRRIHLLVVADETLFWLKDHCVTSWPNLEKLDVMFHMVSPSGKWYFEGPGGEGRDMAGFNINDASYPPLVATALDDEMDHEAADGELWDNFYSNRMRIVPNDTVLRPLLEAFAIAAANMITLKEAALWCPLAWEPNYDDQEMETNWLSENTWDERELAWGIYYMAPGQRNYIKTGEEPVSKTRQLWWRVAKWRPDFELRGLFQQIGRTTWDDDMEEHWEDDTFGDGLVSIEYFDEDIDELGRIPSPC
jgi:hypothetical protein